MSNIDHIDAATLREMAATYRRNAKLPGGGIIQDLIAAAERYEERAAELEQQQAATKAAPAPTVSDLNAHAIGKDEWTLIPIVVCGIDAKPTIPVLAYVCGHFAVHHSQAKAIFTDFCTLTHLPTGAVVTQHVDSEALMDLAERLEGMGDWSFTDMARAPRAAVPVITDFIQGAAEAA